MGVHHVKELHVQNNRVCALGSFISRQRTQMTYQGSRERLLREEEKTKCLAPPACL